LRPNSYKSTDYLDELIELEKTRRQPDYMKRISGLQDMKDRLNIVSKMVDGAFDV
jgi:hypothetical protein